MKRINIPIAFVVLGILALLATLFFGLLSSIVYIKPSFFKDLLPFNQMRPLHVSNAVAWIVLTATGGVYHYFTKQDALKWKYPALIKTHFYIFLISGVLIWASYLTGIMGGREYLVFTPILMIPVLIGWLLFGINYISSIAKKIKGWPVYNWMWLLGICFMIYHLMEANFWNLSHFSSDFILDKTVQWKSYGSFVGSWNMLVYGTAIYLMTKIKGDPQVARGSKVFFFFFLGLTNLMFGWAHHTYTLPTLPWVRYVAYFISMTEWIIFGNIIYTWSKTVKKQEKEGQLWAYRFLIASDVWVFINLFLALLMSIPAINYFTHGTHVTVAHSMGTTIGINTSILLASLCYIVQLKCFNEKAKDTWFKIGYYLFNISLFAFWMALILAGYYRSVWMFGENNISFSEMQEASNPFFFLFIMNGFILAASIVILLLRLLKELKPKLFSPWNTD